MSEWYNLNDTPENYTDEDLIEAFILDATGKGNDSHAWAFPELHDLVRDHPERAWGIILALTERAPDDPDFIALLAAGPMENLLSNHSAAFIDRVEQRAATDSKFNYMLGGVWRQDMTEDIWSRLNTARNEVW